MIVMSSFYPINVMRRAEMLILKSGTVTMAQFKFSFSL